MSIDMAKDNGMGRHKVELEDRPVRVNSYICPTVTAEAG